MFSPFLFFSILGSCATAVSSITWVQPQRSAIVKLDMPGYPSWVVDEASAVVLNFTMSSDNKTLMLNNKEMLPLQNSNIPPRITARQVPADISERQMKGLVDNDMLNGQWEESAQENRLFELDYDRLVWADPTGGPPYHNHVPTLRFRIMGIGAQSGNDVLDVQKQNVVHVTLTDENHGKSDDPKRSYAITELEIKSVKESYDAVHRGPEADEERECTTWSWTCPDNGMYELQSPYHRFIWRKKFDEFGRIGSMRHAVVEKMSAWKEEVWESEGSTILVSFGALICAVSAVIAGIKAWGNLGSKRKGVAKAPVQQGKVPRVQVEGKDLDDEDDEDEAWLASQTQQAGEVEITVDELSQMIDLVSTDKT